MFDLKPQKALLPSKADIDRLKLDAIIAQHPITPDNCKSMHMPPEYVQKLAHAWDSIRGPLPNLNNFGISVESHPSRQGFVILTARYRDGIVRPGVELVLDSDSEFSDEEDVLKFEVGDGEIEKRPESFWQQVWTPFLAVTQIVSLAPKIQPNSRCKCGSGKKHKKCCGRRNPREEHSDGESFDV